MKHRVDSAERLRAEQFPRLLWAEDLSGRRFAIVGAFDRFPRYLGRTPADAVLGRGGVVEAAVTAGLDYAVFGNGREKGKAEAQRQAEKLAASGKPVVLDEAGFIHLLRPKLDGARFHVAGELDFGRGAAATAPAALVVTLGAVYADQVDAQLDYLVVGLRRGPGKAAALAAAEKLIAGGAGLQILSEDMFIDLLRAHAGAATQPVQAASPLAELAAALPSVTDAGRIKRALDMLRRERMQLFTEVSDDHVAGIVRSQTGYSDYYSTRLHADGRYSCCDPSLAWCMGMGGGVCKHLLALLLGLVQSQQLPAATARAWLAAAQQPKSRKSAGGTPIKDLLAETILRYKAASAGELDWRPLETVPEDFYAF
ncbi:MAG: hypothetical protein MUE46_11645 [Xanthomonadales bacterium]|jgi:hypothetical protein|nr:hypothetical protein [Xanthomonadales bacterium]